MNLQKIIATAALTATTALTAIAIPQTANAATTHRCTQGDPPIQASMRTSCAFAGQAVTTYANAAYGFRHATLRIWSPTTHRFYRVHYQRTGGYRTYGGTVTATGPNGIWMRFSGDI